MIRSVTNTLRRFWRREGGNSTVEFAIVFPAFIMVLLSAVELGIMSFRHTHLERGLDMAVRDLRLGTGTQFDHDNIRDSICNYAGVLPECQTKLRLQMVTNDLRNWQAPPAFTCTDSSKEVQPAITFQNGTDNELMLVRACLKFAPIFPTTGMGMQLTKDGAGDAMMVASSAFVQEPR